MLTLKHLVQYKDISLLAVRYALRDFRLRPDPDKAGLGEDDPERPLEPDIRERAEGFARSLKEMGPAFIKFGQVLSTRPDIVPPEYIAVLESFQDDLEPFPFAQAREIIESDLGAPLEELFKSFDEEPLAAASLGQVHKAVLKNGRHAAVKVQRPGVREAAERDLEVLAEIAQTLEARTGLGRRINLSDMVRRFRATLTGELNYLQEAKNAALLARNLAEFPKIHVPAVFENLSSQRVLTMELVRGVKLARVAEGPPRPGGPRLAAALLRAYLKQVGVDGFWHCDPHPGNIFLRGDHVVLLDFGMTARIGDEQQNQLMRLLLSLTENRGAEVADIALEMGAPQDGFDPEKFRRDIAQAVADFHGLDARRANTGQLLFRVVGLAADDGLQIPGEVGLLAKTLLHLDGVTRALDPGFDPARVTRDYAESLLAQKLRRQLNPRNFYTAFLELSQLALELPRRSRGFIEQLAAGKTGVNLKLSQADDLLAGLQRIANRITAGLISAALIVGSSLILRDPSPPPLQLLGAAGYVAAAGLGLYLLLSTLRQDRSDRDRAKAKMK
ncbi:MAG: ABC1 kinase family protein [Elusimicrobiota bacterium]